MPIDKKALAEGYMLVSPSMHYGQYFAAVRAYEAAKAAQQPIMGGVSADDHRNAGLVTGSPPTHQPDEATAFRTWAADYFEGLPMGRDGGGNYFDERMQAAWRAWQYKPKRELSAVEAMELYRLMAAAYKEPDIDGLEPDLEHEARLSVLHDAVLRRYTVRRRA